MHFEIPILSRGLKLSNSKPRCRVSALHIFVKYIPPMALWHWACWDKCFFIFFLHQPPYHCWKSNRGLKLSRNLRTPETNHLHISIVYSDNSYDKEHVPRRMIYREWLKEVLVQLPLGGFLMLEDEVAVSKWFTRTLHGSFRRAELRIVTLMSSNSWWIFVSLLYTWCSSRCSTLGSKKKKNEILNWDNLISIFIFKKSKFLEYGYKDFFSHDDRICDNFEPRVSFLSCTAHSWVELKARK